MRNGITIFISLISVAFVLISLLAVSAFGQKQDLVGPIKKSDYAELTKAPKKAIGRWNPMAPDPDAVAAGANLFDQHCAECHGELAEGTHKGPSLRVDTVRQAMPGTLFWLLTNGVVRGGMPVWSKLPKPQRWQLVSYLKSLGSAGTPSQ